jgi:hypothetical protein
LPHCAAGIAAARGRCNGLLVTGIRVKVAKDIANNFGVDFETSEFELDRLDNLVEDH